MTRIILPVYANMGVATSRSCAFRGCNNSTREGKPYCPDHVGEHEYVKGLLIVLAEKAAEEDRVRQRGWKAVQMEGLNAQELILHLSLHGKRTVKRLSREFQLESSVIEAYVACLKRAKKVALGRTTRGSTTVRLVA